MSGTRIGAASAVVVRDDGRVLLVRRAKPPLERVLTPPGGRIEAGETAAEAAVREVREETGLEVTVLEHVADVEVEAADDGSTAGYRISVHLAAPADESANPSVLLPTAASDAREL